jgi:hypothetical protein
MARLIELETRDITLIKGRGIYARYPLLILYPRNSSRIFKKNLASNFSVQQTMIIACDQNQQMMINYDLSIANISARLYRSA